MKIHSGYERQDMNDSIKRDQVIIRTSGIGIAANILLAAFKAVIGLVTHSIAITMDAVNNLSDALSSVITIVGTKLATRQPDKEHPWGHGRAEYLSAMVISVIVLYAGVTSLIESVQKIIHPQTPDYSLTALVIVAVGVSPNPLVPKSIQGLELGRKNTIAVNDDMQSSRAEIFAGGDIVRGGATVILAMGDGRRAALNMDKHLRGEA